jgi:histidyl-tRNA synthetase
MARPKPLSGFPEWTPDQRIVELALLDHLRATFELHGYSSIETRSVEPLTTLLSEGETSKEVYALRRASADPDEGQGELGLHFDLTVPTARYVLEHAPTLAFPWRRYQVQRSWRGERPQEGRYREFVQADIDVIGRGSLPIHYDAEMPVVMAEALRGLPLPPITVHANNRKVSEGFYRGLGIPDPVPVLRTVDKLDKIGPGRVYTELVEQVGCTEAQAEACLGLAEIQTPDGSFADRVRALGVRDDLLDEGLAELAMVVDEANRAAPGLLVADLRIARGLDYYTGTVYETALTGHEDLGAVCSGGRYDDLAQGADEVYPGVGISIGVTRILGRLFGRGLLRASRPTPTCVLVALHTEAGRPASAATAAALRGRGIAAEVAPEAVKYGRQIRYAERRGIPFVWFPGRDGGPDEVKDIRSGEQVPADAATWSPPEPDLRPRVLGPEPDGGAGRGAGGGAG